MVIKNIFKWNVNIISSNPQWSERQKLYSFFFPIVVNYKVSLYLLLEEIYAEEIKSEIVIN